MNLLLLLAFAVPLTCLAFLSSLGFLGVMTIGGIMHLFDTRSAAAAPKRSENAARIISGMHQRS
jgi:hypothetical protein